MFLIDAKVFGDNVRHYRTRECYSMGELARISGLTVHMIDAMERGVHVPTHIQHAAIAAALAVPREQLLMPRPIEPDTFEAC